MAFSQEKKEKGDIDAKYECTYSIKFVNDTTKMSTGREDWFILKIGDDLTYGYSYLDFYRDSLLTTPGGAKIFAESFLRDVENGSITKSSDFYSIVLMGTKLYKDYEENKLKVLDNVSVHWFIYEEELIPQNWMIAEDTMTIAGYVCQKAICEYRGRSYEAWFTPAISISEGPWKFYGLPGLIMKLYDIKHHYDFELIGIKKIEEKIDVKVLSAKKMNRFTSPKLTEIARKDFLLMKLGEKGNLISKMDLSRVGLSTEPIQMKYGYIELDLFQ
jgi:GLPGLI family protein